MNIGITFGVEDKNISFWDNGDIQKIFNLYYLLAQISEFNVYVINYGIEIEELNDDFKNTLDDVKFVRYDNIKKKVDIVIEIGIKLSKEVIKELRKNKAKIVCFKTNNEAIEDIQDILFDNKKDEIINDNYDEIWITEQHQKHNELYLEELYKCKVCVLPFIWNDKYINYYEKILSKDNLTLKYVNGDKVKKDITIFEANDNITKNTMYSILIAERAYNKRPELFNKIRILNTIKFKNNKRFLSFVSNLNIKKNKVATFENRFITPYILAKFTDVVITNQWDEDLNNLYFDVLFGNYPMIHNSNKINLDMYKYNDFNIELGANKLIDAITKHTNPTKYSFYCKEIINKYHISNYSNILKYKEKIEEIYKNKK